MPQIRVDKMINEIKSLLYFKTKPQMYSKAKIAVNNAERKKERTLQLLIIKQKYWEKY